MELREKDTQKVVAGLKCCIPHIQRCSDCYLKERKDNCYGTLLMDAVQHIEELKNKNERLGELLVRKTALDVVRKPALDGGRAQRPSPTMEWISVEDRLPEENGTYLIAVKGSYVSHFTGFDIESNEFCDNVFRKADVTHWMQLPEPPKPKEPTFRDVFLKAFPKAPLGYNGALKLCACNVFPQINCSLSDGCVECWNQPYFEEKVTPNEKENIQNF